ncbi:hypothetical protein KVV02_002462 [Mortierella alpina]|uniref:Transcription factor tau subunit sfc6 n=1 Tax=Mortierella alpina TaxID=64518 RepID=A0A9P7ZYE6_MORAP|nr:hypothetical protein KVV02_002462 [Mortierella alpina]
MSPRPVRTVAKRSKAGKTVKRELQSDDDFREDQDSPAARIDENDDSDEYVAGSDAKGGNADGDDDERDMDMDVDMDMDIDDDNNNDERKLKLMPTKTRRRRPAVKTYSVSLDEMNKLLTTHDDTTTSIAAEVAEFPAGSVVNTEGLMWKPVVRQSKAVPATAPKRVNRPPAKKTVSKKGFMHDSEMIPNVWKLSYQAPTSKELRYVSMQEQDLRDTVYPNINSSQKDFRVVNDPAELEEYLPVMATSTIYAREEQLDMPTMTAHYLETTTKTGVNDGYIFNTGFSVWALDWCPLPSYEDAPDRNMSYIAIGGLPDTAENCIDRDQLYPLGKQDAHPNIIQIWSMNCNTNEQGELRDDPKAYLALCILHSYGAVFDMKWCPTGSFKEASSAPDGLDRLGILAATFSDGTIRIFSVPEPGSLRDKLGRPNTGDNTPEPVYIEYPEPYATIRMGDVCFMSVSWGTSERLAAGATNGTIPIWDMKSILNQPKETLAEKDSEYLDPVYLPQVHDVSVRSVDWFRNEDSKIIPWIVVSSGYDGRVRYTDLHDIYGQIDVKTILGVPMVTTCIPWAEGCVYVDIDFGAKLDQLYLESRGFRMFNAQGTIWDLSYSDFQPFLAAAMSDGRVKISNPTYKAKRGYGMVQNHIYQLQEVQREQHNSENDPSSDANAAANSSHGAGEASAEKSAVFRYQEGEEKEYISKSAGFLSFYGANVAIQKVQWSRCYHSAAWLASGSAGGLVKVDNTMLRKEEGGEGNKIAYKPEPYVLKKRLAAGHANDGQRPKIGRPKKIRDPEESGGSKKGKKTGRTKRKTPSKASHGRLGDSEEEEEDEAVQSESEAAELEGDEAHVAGGDDDEFQDRGKTTSKTTTVAEDPAPRRTTRLQTGKLAPIFMRASSNNRSQTPSNEDEDEGDNDDDDNEEEDEHMHEHQGESPIRSKISPRKAQPTGDVVKTTEPAVPKKTRGRPRKTTAVAGTDASGSSIKNLLPVTKAMPSTFSAVAEETTSASNAAEGHLATEGLIAGTLPDEDDIVRGVAAESTTSTSDKGRAKKAVAKASVKAKGKALKSYPPTVKSVAPPQPQLSAEATIAAVAAVVAAQDRTRSQDTATGGAAGSVQVSAGRMAGEAGDETEDETEAAAVADGLLKPVSSLKAPSVAPSSPRKTRGPSTRTKKQLDEIKKQHRLSLKEIWGDGAGKGGGSGKE